MAISDSEPNRSRSGGVCFEGAASAAVLALIALFIWPMFDASFRYTDWLAKVDFGLAQVAAVDPDADALLTSPILGIAHEWHQLGSRLVLLLLVYATAFAASIVLVIGCVRAKSPGRVIAAVAILGGWLALLTTRSMIEEWSTRRQASHLLPRAEAAATALRAHWPTQSGMIPPDLRVIVSSRRPYALVVKSRDPYPIREEIGSLIEKSADGTIRFKLSGAYDYNLEFHPSGAQPAAYVEAFGLSSSNVISTTRLKEDWYLVRYAN